MVFGRGKDELETEDFDVSDGCIGFCVCYIGFGAKSLANARHNNCGVYTAFLLAEEL